MYFYQYSVEDTARELHSSSTEGLSETTVLNKIKLEGLNEIEKRKGRNFLSILTAQFKNLLVMLLLVAAVFSLYLGSYRDAIVLFCIVIINALIGFYQDLKSENILASITSLIVDKCIVIREGRKREIPSNRLVKGDLVLLNEGEGIPADIRLVSSSGFAVNEFILTGESVARDKDAVVQIHDERGISERDNCVFMGTAVARGEALGLVYATGMHTELGKIAASSAEIIQEASPLQKEMNTLAYKITYATLVLGVILFLLRIFLNDSISEALIFAIGVAAAMVPEGLPAQISIALSLGVRKLAHHNAIVKNLSSVEALGAATVIATDKTGTITRNEMTISFCYFDGRSYRVSGNGFEPKGIISSLDEHELNSATSGSESDLPFAWGFLASTSGVHPPDEFHTGWYALGDPTETAFATLAIKAGLTTEVLEKRFSRIQIFPFDSVRKCMTVVRNYGNKNRAFVKGSIESILSISDRISHNGLIRAISGDDKVVLLSLAQAHAANGLRIIALAYKDLPETISYTQQDTEDDLIFYGFACMMDPPHDGVKETIQAAFNAHIRVMMITGDNEITAAAIAEQIGLKNADGSLPEIINEKKLSTLSDNVLSSLLESRSLIFSRVSPDEKLRIVNVLKDRGDVVAVTGDGVNDTLSLKRADIGVAMGKNGSKIAQEAATMVLLNDNFSTIVRAIREGRTIYRNIQKNVISTLATNVAELSCVLAGFVGVFFNLPSVILAIHILLIDLIGEMLPLLALSIDPAEKSLMEEMPRKKGNLVEKRVMGQIALTGLLRGLIATVCFWFVYTSNAGNPVQHEIAVSTTFISIILTQFVNIFSIRNKGSIFSFYSLNNPYLFGGIAVSMLISLAVIYIPFLNQFLHTAPLGWSEWMYPIVGTSFYLVWCEVEKMISRIRRR